MRNFTMAAAVLAAALAGGQAGAVSFTGSYAQDFDTLAATGTSAALPAGWSFVETGTNADATYTAGTGSSATGDTYSFGSAGATDRALGTLRSGTLVSTIFAQFENESGAALTGLLVGYIGEQWRLGTAGRADRLDFAYSINDGAFVNVDALDFASPNTAGVGARDGNAAANRTVIAPVALAGVTLGSGGTIRFRWTDLDATGADDGLAIDDFTLTGAITAVPEPAGWAMMVGGFGLLGASLRRRRPSTLFA